ncbi:hypothetical protein JCM10207_003806 [Rhodosporidiobolus poonsookiae]
MDAATQAAMVQTLLDTVLGPLLISIFVAFAGCGVTVALAGSYYATFGLKDKLVFRYGVGFLALLILFDTASQGSWIYRWTIIGFSKSSLTRMPVRAAADVLDPAANPLVMTEMPWQLSIFAFNVNISVTSCQAFFLWRIWVISHSLVLVAALSVLALGSTGMMFYIFVQTVIKDKLDDFQAMIPIFWGWLSVVAANDIAITASTWYFIVARPRRSNGAEYNRPSPLLRIINRLVQTNSFSTGIQILTMILLGVKPGTFWYSVPSLLEVKIYTASLIATLNARHSGSDGMDFDSSGPGGYGVNTIGGGGPGLVGSKHAGAASRGARSGFGTASNGVGVQHNVQVRVETNPDYAADAAAFGGSPYAIKFEDVGDVEQGSLEEKGSSRGREGQYEEMELRPRA